MSRILHCLPFISNNRQTAEFSTYYLVSKVFPSVLPLCNPVSLMLTPKMAWCPDTDSISELGALKSVPALCKYASRCDNDLSLVHILEHCKALSQNNLQLWSTSLVLDIVLTTLHVSPCSIYIRYLLLLPSFYRWCHWSTDKLGKLYRVTMLTRFGVI